jgi:hypothetical protein
MNTGRVTVFLFSLSLLLGIASFAAAQSSVSARTSGTTQGTTVAADEIKLAGTIQKVVSDPASGHPQGIHLIVASPQGIFDVSAGPYLAKDIKDSLATGQPVQVNGVLRTLSGQSYLLAREMTVAGRQVTVRNEYGFPVRSQSPVARSQRSHAGLNGGAQ